MSRGLGFGLEVLDWVREDFDSIWCMELGWSWGGLLYS